KKERYITCSPFTAITHKGQSSFFGYYDKSPVSKAGTLLFCSTAASTTQEPRPSDHIDVVVWDPQTGTALSTIKTRAFNWQQGCRAHWLDEDSFIYNDYDEHSASYVAIQFSISQSRVVNRFSHAVQDSFQTEYFLSINYRRLS